jgi:hypothetical protein
VAVLTESVPNRVFGSQFTLGLVFTSTYFVFVGYCNDGNEMWDQITIGNFYQLNTIDCSRKLVHLSHMFIDIGMIFNLWVRALPLRSAKHFESY